MGAAPVGGWLLLSSLLLPVYIGLSFVLSCRVLFHSNVLFSSLYIPSPAVLVDLY